MQRLGTFGRVASVRTYEGKNSARKRVISAIANHLIEVVARDQAELAAARTASVELRLQRVLDALSAERVGTQHFTSLTGYGHGDQGREVVDRVFARVLGAEAAAVRLQFVSGTHAIAAALFGVLRPGDRLLSITGRPTTPWKRSSVSAVRVKAPLQSSGSLTKKSICSPTGQWMRWR